MTWRPGFAASVMLALAVGIGPAAAVFSLANALLLRPLPLPDARQLVTFGVRTAGGQGSPFVSYPMIESWRSIKGVQTVAAVLLSDETFVGPSETVLAHTAHVEPGWFRMMGVRPLLGRTLRRGDPTTSVVVSDRFWREHLDGRRDVLNTSVRLNGVVCRVVGVMPGRFTFPASDTDAWLPLPISSFMKASVGARWALAFGRLEPGYPVGRAAVEAQALFLNTVSSTPSLKHAKATLTTLRSRIVGDAGWNVKMLAFAASAVMAIAVLNLAMLLLAYAEDRRSDVAVRIALGASPWQAARALLADVLLLFVIGSLGGMVLGDWMANGVLVSAVDPKVLAQLHLRGLPFDARVIAFALTVSLLVLAGLGAGLVIRARKVPAGNAPAIERRSYSRRGRFRLHAYVAAQCALGLVLLAVAGMFVRTLWNLDRQDLGFDYRHLTTASLGISYTRHPHPPGLDATTGSVLAAVRSVPGISRAAATQLLFLNDYALKDRISAQANFSVGPASLKGRIEPVSTDYFATIGAHLVAGRSIDDRDRLGTEAVTVINETAARQLWPGHGPLGRRVWVRRHAGSVEPLIVVGVVRDLRRDLRQGGPDVPPGPELFVPLTQFPSYGMTVVVRSKLGARSLGRLLKSRIRQVDPTAVMWDVQTASAQLKASLSWRRFEARALACFAAIALLLCVIGVYGLMRYVIASSSREIAIRIAIGASRRSVFSLVLGNAAVVCLAGTAAGAVLSMLVSLAVAGTLYGVEATDPLNLLAPAAALIASALLAAGGAARRAMNIDPMTIMKAE